MLYKDKMSLPPVGELFVLHRSAESEMEAGKKEV